MNTYPCPSCGHDVSLQWQFCRYCYIDLRIPRLLVQMDREHTTRYLMEQLATVGINAAKVGWNDHVSG